jgi:HD-GYP domain-containing protein (c-di-GMP phosphodiesterase class II)
MTSDRPYRQGLSLETAKAEIKRCAGTQFDPDVVDIFLSLPDSTWAELRANASQPFRLAYLKSF